MKDAESVSRFRHIKDFKKFDDVRIMVGPISLKLKLVIQATCL
jgi:hypothetical protein